MPHALHIHARYNTTVLLKFCYNTVCICTIVLPTCVSVYHTYARCLWKPEKGDLTLELQTLVSPYVRAGNETRVLCKIIQSSLHFYFIFFGQDLLISAPKMILLFYIWYSSRSQFSSFHQSGSCTFTCGAISLPPPLLTSLNLFFDNSIHVYPAF